VKFRRFLRTAENDFEGTRTTIPRVRDATGQGGDGGALVCVHAGRGQDTCISEQSGGHTRGQSCGIADLGGVRERRQGERAGRCAPAVQGVAGHCADVDAGEQGVKTLASKVSRRERASWEVQAPSPHIRVLFYVLLVLHIVVYCRPMGGWCAKSPRFSWF